MHVQMPTRRFTVEEYQRMAEPAPHDAFAVDPM